MIETKYSYTISGSKVIERIMEDEHVAINHMILPKGEGLPEHYSNSNVYMIVAGGIITIRLNDQEEHSYPAGSILAIPYKTKMNVYNIHDETLEFFVVKAPGPKMINNK